MLDDHIKQLSKDLELGSPIPQETQGVYLLTIGTGLDVTITDLAPGFGLLCAIAPYPTTNEETFLTQAMLANLFGQGTEGAILGLDEGGTVLTLSMENTLDDSYQTFKETLEDFLNAVDFWRDEITEASKSLK